MKIITNQKLPIITCPHCGCQYTPSEIFMPGQLIGQSETVIKDALGKILYEEYKEDGDPELTEHFTCENCGKSFVIEATLSFKTHEEDEELDFDNEYTSLLD